MFEFDIRVTGALDVPADEIAEASEKLVALIADLHVGLVAEGAKTHHISLNNQPVNVSLTKVDISAKNPDELLAKIDLAAKSKISSPMPSDVTPDGHESA